MNRNEALELLRTHEATLAQRFSVIGLALFGSFARDQAVEDSDVDILVRFDAPPDWQRYFGARFYLEDLRERIVELATRQELRTGVRPHMAREVADV